MHSMGSKGPAEKTDLKTLKKSISSLLGYCKKYVAVIIIALI